MAEYRDSPVYDIPLRQKQGPKPHVDDASYKNDHAISVKETDAFWRKVRSSLISSTEGDKHTNASVFDVYSLPMKRSTGSLHSRLFSAVALPKETSLGFLKVSSMQLTIASIDGLSSTQIR